MKAGWRERAPQITVGLLLGSAIVWLWLGWQVGLTAVLAALVIAVVIAPRRPDRPCDCANCQGARLRD